VGVRAVPRLCIELCPGIYLTTEENHGKTSVRAAGCMDASLKNVFTTSLGITYTTCHLQGMKQNPCLR